MLKMSSGGSIAVEHLTTNPKMECSNPVTIQKQDKMAQNIHENVQAKKARVFVTGKNFPNNSILIHSITF